jgi:hypothetical protein
VDTVLTLTGREGVLSLTPKKPKKTEGGKIIPLKLEQVTLPTGLTSCVIQSLGAGAVTDTWRDRIYAYLDAAADLGATGSDLLRGLQVKDPDRRPFYKGLNRLRMDEGCTARAPVGGCVTGSSNTSQRESDPDGKIVWFTRPDTDHENA